MVQFRQCLLAVTCRVGLRTVCTLPENNTNERVRPCSTSRGRDHARRRRDGSGEDRATSCTSKRCTRLLKATATFHRPALCAPRWWMAGTRCCPPSRKRQQWLEETMSSKTTMALASARKASSKDRTIVPTDVTGSVLSGSTSCRVAGTDGRMVNPDIVRTAFGPAGPRRETLAPTRPSVSIPQSPPSFSFVVSSFFQINHHARTTPPDSATRDAGLPHAVPVKHPPRPHLG